MWRRKRTERPSPEVAAQYEQAIQDASEQRQRLDAELPLRRKLQDIRAKNHLAEELYAVLSERRAEGQG